MLVDNTGEVADDPAITENSGACKWVGKEAQLLGDLFAVHESESARCCALLEKVHLNFGENGRCEKKKKRRLKEKR